MTFNAAHVDRLTRRWLRSERAGFGEPMLADLETVLVRHRRNNLCGLVYDAAMLLALPGDVCEAVGSAADLLYCAFGMVDDIQDGDVDDYLPGHAGQQINVALALRELGVLRMLDVVPSGFVLDLVVRRVSETALQMTLSQREELAAKAAGYQPPWSIAAYERVARGAAGAEVALFLFLAGVMADALGAAGVREELLGETLHRVGYHCGVALQIAVDSATRDERVTVLPAVAVERLRYRQAELFIQDAAALPSELVALLTRIAGAEDLQWHRSTSQAR